MVMRLLFSKTSQSPKFQSSQSQHRSIIKRFYVKLVQNACGSKPPNASPEKEEKEKKKTKKQRGLTMTT